MAIINIAKTASSTTNISKVSIGETWASIVTSWSIETRTWAAVSQLIGNISKTSSAIINDVRAT